MAVLWHFGFGIAVIIAVVRTTCCVRHDTFWGEKGKIFFVLFLKPCLRFNGKERNFLKIKTISSLGFQHLVSRTLNLFLDGEYVKQGLNYRSVVNSLYLSFFGLASAAFIGKLTLSLPVLTRNRF